MLISLLSLNLLCIWNINFSWRIFYHLQRVNNEANCRQSWIKNYVIIYLKLFCSASQNSIHKTLRKTLFKNFFFNFFYWRIIALQYCVLYQTSTWISHRFAYVPSISLPIHTSRLSMSPGLSSLSHTANSNWLSVLHVVVYVSMLLPPYIPPCQEEHFYWMFVIHEIFCCVFCHSISLNPHKDLCSYIVTFFFNRRGKQDGDLKAHKGDIFDGSWVRQTWIQMPGFGAY